MFSFNVNFNAYFLRILFEKENKGDFIKDIRALIIVIHTQFIIICPNLPSKANHMSDTTTIYCVDTCLCRVLRSFVVPLSVNDD